MNIAARHKQIKKDMAKRKRRSFLSLFLIISSLLLVVFLKVKTRELGYSVWDKSKKYERVYEQYTKEMLEYKAMVSMENLEAKILAQGEWKAPKKGQVIQIINKQLAVPQ